MELLGSAYLYALATVSITFVGFSALAIFFRQTLGGGMTGFDVFFTISFIQLGFLVTTGSLVPPLLSLCELAPDIVWRASSAIMVIPILLFVATFHIRRSAITKSPTLFYAWAILCVQLLAVISLLLNITGKPFVSGVASYAIAMTLILISAGIAFLLGLKRLLGQSENKS